MLFYLCLQVDRLHFHLSLLCRKVGLVKINSICYFTTLIYNLVRTVLFSGAELAFIVLNFNILPFKKKSIMHLKTFLLSKRECFYIRICLHSFLFQVSHPFHFQHFQQKVRVLFLVAVMYFSKIKWLQVLIYEFLILFSLPFK